MPIAGTIDSTDDNYLETHCIGMQGTHCMSGTGVGIVVATGDQTVFGCIAKLTNQPSTGRTTLEKEIFRFIALIVSLMLFWMIVFIIIWYLELDCQHLLLIDIFKGYVPPETVSVLDKRAPFDCRLRQCGHSFHAGRPSYRADCQCNYYCQHHAKE